MSRFWEGFTLVVLLLVVCAITSSLFGCASTAQRDLRSAATSFTRQGMGVVDPAHVLQWQPDDVIDDVMQWWCFRFTAKCQEIKEWAYLGVIFVEESVGPLRDPWYPQVGPASGLTYGRNMRIRWNPATKGAQFEAILRHELGHVAIRKILPGIEDHVFMQNISYPWK